MVVTPIVCEGSTVAPEDLEDIGRQYESMNLYARNITEVTLAHEMAKGLRQLHTRFASHKILIYFANARKLMPGAATERV
jgi:hypothetical protein